MSDPAPLAPPGRGLRVVAVLAVRCKLPGVTTYRMRMTAGPGAVQALPEAERVRVQDIPPWVTASDARAVFAGVAGGALLLARRTLAVPLFALSLRAIALQMGHALLLTPMVSIRGPTATLLPGLGIAGAVALFACTRSAQRRGWLA